MRALMEEYQIHGCQVEIGFDTGGIPLANYSVMIQGDGWHVERNSSMAKITWCP